MSVFRTAVCGALAIAASACGGTSENPVPVIVPEPLYLEDLATAVPNLELLANGTTVTLTWSAHPTEADITYMVSRTQLGAATSEKPTAAPRWSTLFKRDRTTFNDVADPVAWTRTDELTFSETIDIVGNFEYRVFAEFPSNELSQGSNKVSFTTAGLASLPVPGTSETATCCDPPTPPPAAEDPCLSLMQLVETVPDLACFDIIRYDNRGPDFTWNTTDDVANSRQFIAMATSESLFVFPGDFEGRNTLLASFNDAGSDGDFGTSDDVIQLAINQFAGFGTTREVTERFSPAATCVRRTASLTGYDVVFATGADTARGLQYDHPGADQTWYSEDDALSAWYSRTSSGNTVTDIIVNSATGPDLRWFTADDYTSSRERFLPGADAATMAVVYPSPGSDLAFGTGDDLFVEFGTYDYNVTGEVSAFTLYAVDPVSGGQVFATDRPSARINFHYQAGNLVSMTTVSPGTDSTFNSGDDQILDLSTVQTGCPSP